MQFTRIERQTPLISAAILILLGAPASQAASPAKVSKSASPVKSAAAQKSDKSAEMDMGGMDMKDCPMMRQTKRKFYEGSAAVIANDAFVWKTTPGKVPAANKPVTLKFSFNWKKDGKPLTNLEIVHEKPCHLIIVSKDLKEFQHIHPDITGSGKMAVTTSFPKAGQYKMYMQFTPKGDGEYTLVQDLNVGNAKTAKAQLKEDTAAKIVDGYTLKLPYRPSIAGNESSMEVEIEKDGKPVNYIENYLGAGGHGVMISEDLTQYLHIHPRLTLDGGRKYESPISFRAIVPKPGLYRAWMQFQIKGKIVIGVWDLVIKPSPE